jgi:hypothetical protein
MGRKPGGEITLLYILGQRQYKVTMATTAGRETLWKEIKELSEKQQITPPLTPSK